MRSRWEEREGILIYSSDQSTNVRLIKKDASCQFTKVLSIQAIVTCSGEWDEVVAVSDHQGICGFRFGKSLVFIFLILMSKSDSLSMFSRKYIHDMNFYHIHKKFP